MHVSRSTRMRAIKPGNAEEIPLGDEKQDDTNNSQYSRSSLWQDDGANLVLLTLLYCFQGIPLGLCGGSLPFILKKDLSYAAIGVFSLSTIPFSLKLFWSPIVDSVFSRRIGRRKSWIVPMQMISGTLMFFLSFRIDALIASGSIVMLTFIFGVLVFLFATQDIAVDGLALEILRPENLAWAATCQSVGQSLGFAASFSGFLALAAFDLMTLGTFLMLSGVAFVAGSFWLLMFVREQPPQQGQTFDLANAYAQLWIIMRLPAVRRLAVYLMTAYVPLVASDRALNLRLIDSGVSKELLATFSAFSLPLSLAFAVLTGRLARRGKPLSSTFRIGMIVRLGSAFGGMAVLGMLDPKAGSLSSVMIAVLFLLYACTSFGSSLTFISSCAFFNVISDPLIGGVYLTLLNTISNMGRAWPVPIVLYAIDSLGFGTVNAILLVIGCVYVYLSRPTLVHLEQLPSSAWACDSMSSPV